VGAIAQQRRAGSLRGRCHTSSSPWPPGVGSKRKMRRSQRWDRGAVPPGAPLHSPNQSTVSGFRTSDQPSMANGAMGADQAPLQSPQCAPGRLCDSSHAVKVELGRALTMSQVPAPLSTKCAVHSVHDFSWDVRGFYSPSSPSATINDSDPHAPSVAAPPLPDLLCVARHPIS
jgi:hypothetical protein